MTLPCCAWVRLPDGGAEAQESQSTETAAELARHARTLDASQLTILGKPILAYHEQDRRHPHDTPETRRSLRFHHRDKGYEPTE